MVALARTNESTISDSEAAMMIIRAGDVMFGKKAVNEFCEKGMRADQLVDLIRKCFDMINGKNVDGEDVEEISDEDGMTAASGNKAKK
jgi:hypothetical protein